MWEKCQILVPTPISTSSSITAVGCEKYEFRVIRHFGMRSALEYLRRTPGASIMPSRRFYSGNYGSFRRLRPDARRAALDISIEIEQPAPVNGGPVVLLDKTAAADPRSRDHFVRQRSDHPSYGCGRELCRKHPPAAVAFDDTAHFRKGLYNQR